MHILCYIFDNLYTTFSIWLKIWRFLPLKGSLRICHVVSFELTLTNLPFLIQSTKNDILFTQFCIIMWWIKISCIYSTSLKEYFLNNGLNFKKKNKYFLSLLCTKHYIIIQKWVCLIQFTTLSSNVIHSTNILFVFFLV